MQNYFVLCQHFASCGFGAFDPVVGALKQDLLCFWTTAQSCRALSKMKLTLACSLGSFGRSPILLLTVIVVIMLIIIVYVKPTVIQVVPKLLKITSGKLINPNHSLIPGGEGFYLQHGAREGEVSVAALVPELLLSTKHSWGEQGHLWKLPRPCLCPNMLEITFTQNSSWKWSGKGR